MPIPGNVDENFEGVGSSKIEKPFCRNVVNANDVRAKFADLREIGGSLLRRREQLAGGIGSEWPVGDSFDVEFVSAQPKEFAIDGYS